MRLLPIAVILAGFGCGPATAPARPPVATPAPLAHAAAAGCSLDGTYRFRFRSNGHDGWWFRVKVAGTTAALIEKVSMLALEAGPIDLQADPKQCTFSLRAKTGAAGDLVVDVALDPRTSRFTGTLTRSRALVADEKQQAISGVRNDGSPHAKAACVVPGIYELRFDPAVAWVNEDRDDDRDCSSAPELASPLFVRVEPFGDDLAVTLREPVQPYEEAWADDSVTRSGPCAAAVDIGDGTTVVTLQLTFAGDELAGVAAAASYQIVEDGTEGENIWTCVGANVPISGRRVR